tara:strand:+ start:41 stop:1012 length:972 start_codon:yes stop_codon:yes gene_type:complete
MSNETLERQISLTPEVVKSKLQIALTRVEKTIQSLHDREATLVYNEDCLIEIKEFIEDVNGAERLVDNERKILKEPSLIEGRNVDAGAKIVSTELAAIKQKANTHYQKLCMEVERKRMEAEAEKQRVATIRGYMDNFKIEYSVKISDAKTSKELVDIERRINLETGNSNRYQELLPEFKTLCEPIRSLLTAQKNKVRELEELEITAREAAETGNDEVYLEVQDKKEALEAQIAETRVSVQETATTQAQTTTTQAEVVLTVVPKGGRSTWKWNMVDEKAATKRGWTQTIPNKEKIDEYLKQKREDGIEEEFVEGGVHFFIQKTY